VLDVATISVAAGTAPPSPAPLWAGDAQETPVRRSGGGASAATDFSTTKRWIAFREPHSHGPSHFLEIPPASAVDRVLVIEDEITTGVTTTNLLSVLRAHGFENFSIACLLDQRTAADKGVMEKALRVDDRNGLHAVATSLQELVAFPRRLTRVSDLCLPQFAGASGFNADMSRAVRETASRLIVAVGECVVPPVVFVNGAESMGLTLRFATRSPWVVDNEAITSRIKINGDSHYYLYNTLPESGSAIVIATFQHELYVAVELARILQDERGCITSIVVHA
jgi:hypothetical protein